MWLVHGCFINELCTCCTCTAWQETCNGETGTWNPSLTTVQRELNTGRSLFLLATWQWWESDLVRGRKNIWPLCMNTRTHIDYHTPGIQGTIQYNHNKHADTHLVVHDTVTSVCAYGNTIMRLGRFYRAITNTCGWPWAWQWATSLCLSSQHHFTKVGDQPLWNGAVGGKQTNKHFYFEACFNTLVPHVAIIRARVHKNGG